MDADAEHVEISLASDCITIKDDGCGMNLADVNDKFLTVGYRRREREEVLTPKHGRHVMGRKGIGKLSLFAIADTIRVESTKAANGSAEKTGFLMRTTDIKKAAEEERKPTIRNRLREVHFELDRGTRVSISDLNARATAVTEKALRTRLARRFSIIGPEQNFEVTVNGSAITVEDRDYFPKIEYLWSIGDVGDEYEVAARNAKQKNRIDGTVDGVRNLRVTGWVGTLDEQKSIDELNNTVVLLAWGKLIQEDVLGAVKAGGLFTKYLMGELRADFLDEDEKPDITTSDRQRLKEDDPRYQEVLAWFRQKVLGVVEANWGDWRGKAALENALQIPEVKEWHQSLSVDSKRFAGQLFAKIGKFPKENDSEKRELYKYTILAFEKLRFRDALTEIDQIQDGADVSVLQAVFSGIDELEAAEYHQIAKGRLEVIEAFDKIVPKEKERVIQEYLFNHLWLLHPSWERASTNPQIEKAVQTAFKAVDANLTKEEKRARIDIQYKTAANKHVVVELKKYDVSVNLFDLSKQLTKYRSALTKVLKTKFPDQPRDIEIIAIMGTPPSAEGMDEAEKRAQLRNINARVITYDTLIQESIDSYRDYLDANERLSRLSSIIEGLSIGGERT